VLNFGWVRLNIEINHINIEPQVQIKAKSIIQFDNQHEFRSEKDFDSFKPEFQYLDIYPHHFWLAACYPLPGLVSHVTHVCVITNYSHRFIITNNGLIQGGNKPYTFSVSL